MHLTKFEQTIYAGVVLKLIAAKAGEALADGPGFAHRVGDVAMDQVNEWRTRIRADRMRRQRKVRK